MCKKNQEELNHITSELVEKLLSTSGLKIKKEILYGSYARGDAKEDSDIDIMVLCDNREEELDKRRFEVNSIGSDIGLENDISLEVKIKDNNQFDEWSAVVPFYQSINHEGRVLYG